VFRIDANRAVVQSDAWTTHNASKASISNRCSKGDSWDLQI